VPERDQTAANSAAPIEVCKTTEGLFLGDMALQHRDLKEIIMCWEDECSGNRALAEAKGEALKITRGQASRCETHLRNH